MWGNLTSTKFKASKVIETSIEIKEQEYKGIRAGSQGRQDLQDVLLDLPRRDLQDVLLDLPWRDLRDYIDPI